MRSEEARILANGEEAVSYPLSAFDVGLSSGGERTAESGELLRFHANRRDRVELKKRRGAERLS
ncbi:MAG TPA: hypothetical protein VGH97_17005 [Thermoanaerobaculia bacterium]|jgi:hypothetical protein